MERVGVDLGAGTLEACRLPRSKNGARSPNARPTGLPFNSWTYNDCRVTIRDLPFMFSCMLWRRILMALLYTLSLHFSSTINSHTYIADYSPMNQTAVMNKYLLVRLKPGSLFFPSENFLLHTLSLSSLVHAF